MLHKLRSLLANVTLKNSAQTNFSHCVVSYTCSFWKEGAQHHLLPVDVEELRPTPRVWCRDGWVMCDPGLVSVAQTGLVPRCWLCCVPAEAALCVSLALHPFPDSLSFTNTSAATLKMTLEFHNAHCVQCMEFVGSLLQLWLCQDRLLTLGIPAASGTSGPQAAGLAPGCFWSPSSPGELS